MVTNVQVRETGVSSKQDTFFFICPGKSPRSTYRHMHIQLSPCVLSTPKYYMSLTAKCSSFTKA